MARGPMKLRELISRLIEVAETEGDNLDVDVQFNTYDNDVFIGSIQKLGKAHNTVVLVAFEDAY